MRSIRARLGTGLVLSLVTVFVLQWLVVAAALREMSEAGMVTHMEHDVENLLAGLSFDDTGKPRLDPARIEQDYQRVFSGRYFRIASASDVIRSRSLWDQDLPAATLAAGASERRELTGPQSQRLLVYSRGYSLEDRTVVISVGADLTPLEADLRRFRNRYALASAAALLILLAVQMWLAHASLAPLARAREELRELEASARRNLSEEVPGELAPLVRELNRLLAVMHARLKRSREALGNLAHAMKTPLTLLAQLGGDPRLRRQAGVRATLAAQTEVLRAQIERALTRARLAGAAMPGQRFDIAGELPALVDTLRALYRDKPLDIATGTGHGFALDAEREDMLELFGNLLDNACKWARQRVRLVAEPATDGAGARMMVVTIDDDGPGCPAEELARLSERGVRLDEHTPGHGLGLAIARDIVTSYGGRLAFAVSPLGGLRARVSLPAAQSAR